MNIFELSIASPKLGTITLFLKSPEKYVCIYRINSKLCILPFVAFP